MNDLCKRLRNLYVQNGTNYVQEAADRIEKLENGLKRVQKRLCDTDITDPAYMRDCFCDVHKMIDEVLKE